VTKSIPANPSINKLRAYLIGATGLLTLGVVGLIAGIPGGLRWGAMAVPFAIALGLFWFAFRLYGAPSKTGADITFTADGFVLRVKMAFRKETTRDLKWADLEQVVYAAGGYGTRYFEFRVSDEAAKRMGKVQPTARANRLSLFAFRSFYAPITLMQGSSDEIIARLREAADHAGYVIEKGKYRFGPFVERTTYPVTKSQ